VHMAYGVSDLYGFNVSEPSSPATNVNKRRYFYASFYPDSVGQEGYEPFFVDLLPVKDGIHRKHFSITTRGNDSIWIAHYHVGDRMVYMDQSTDGGLSWSQDTVISAQVGSPLALTQFEDTLYLLTHDGRNNQLSWSKKSFGDTSWNLSKVNSLEERAGSFQSVINRKESGDDIYAVYSEENSQNLLFSSRISGEWTEEVLLENEAPAFIQTGLNSQGEAVIAYLASEKEKLTVGFRENEEWEFQVIDTQSVVRDLSLEVIGDSLHICFYDLNEGALKYARGTKETISWPRVILDESSPIIGTGLSMDQDAEGGLHISYRDIANNLLKYGYRSPAGVWTQKQITSSNAFTISQTYLKVDTANNPIIAAGDGAKTSIFLFEVSADTFAIDTVLTAIPNFQGGPLSLLIDPKNRPWILYNFSDVSAGLRLLRRGPDREWNQVSVLNNQGQIANSFDFYLVDQDFYIIGKKNRADDEGIALLFASEGVTTNLETKTEVNAIAIYPNPAGREIFIEWDNALKETALASMLDMQGREVIQPIHLQPGTLSKRISLTSLPAGIYVITIQAADSFLTKKLLIKGRN
ncbi:MAG: T9SS type A sorting domain-containing protein, partial [Bacteroidota bacterium]